MKLRLILKSVIMKRIASLSFSLFISVSVLSQSLSIELISTGGNSSEFPSGSVCYSIGECIVTGDNNPSITNSGFQQGLDFVITIDEILNYNPLAKIKVFPNPTRDYVMLTLEGEDIKYSDLAISLYSSDFKLIQLNAKPNNGQTIPLDFLASGMYFLRLTSADNQHFIKFIKQ